MHDDHPTHLYRIGETRRFAVQDQSCLMASCFSPGSLINVRNGRQVFTCETRAVSGCPNHGDRGLRSETGQRRHGEGWREDKA